MPVFPRNNVIPFPRGSVFARLRWTLTREGDVRESIATSEERIDRLALEDSRVNSPYRRNPKYPRHDAAHRSRVSNSSSIPLLQASSSERITGAVIGSRRLSFEGYDLAMPLRTYCSRGQLVLFNTCRPCSCYFQMP